MSSFVVLEDMEERVHWLRKFFPDVEVNWFTSVLSMCEHLKAIQVGGSQPAGIILDHDLGGPLFGSTDENGLTGVDAAEMMLTVCPVLVWSVNPEGSAKMAKALQRRTNWAVYKVPFLRTNEHQMMRVLAQFLKTHKERHGG